jgi:hypothetical protein
MARSRRPNVKAVIVSLYGTIVEKMELPDADARWQSRLAGTIWEAARSDLATLNAATNVEVAREKAIKRAARIPTPVAFWQRK